ncbi:MAG: ABC transporter permease [Paracoccaceae bacterium]|nr:ABC transporter permease [Paracoccaceae bacterium]
MKISYARLTRPIAFLYLGFILMMLYFPFIIMAILSFQGPRGGHTFPMRGTSTIWYWKLFNPGELTEYSDVGEFLGNYLGALQRSLVLAVITLILSTVFALMAAQAFRRGFRGSNIVFYVWLLGIIVPGITVSLGSALIVQSLEIAPHWLTTGLAVHVIWTLPFSLVVFLMFFNRFDTTLEDAALTLGATRWQTFRHVTLPIMQPAVLTSMLFAFSLSLDEFQRSLLITGNEQTLPIMVMASVTTRVTPTLYALGTLTTLLSFAVVAGYLALMTASLRRSRRMNLSR